MRRWLGWTLGALLALSAEPGRLAAQATGDSSDELARVLPVEVAQRVLLRIDETRARGLPSVVLRHRALELVAKGVAPERVARAVDDEAAALDWGRQALLAGGRANPTDDEIAAAGTALRRGVDGNLVSGLATSAPSGRSLAVPLLVIASLVDRGLGADAALRRVLARLATRASDQQLEMLAAEGGRRGDEPPSPAGPDVAATKRPNDLGGPAVVPASTIKRNHPVVPSRPPAQTHP